MTNWKRVTINGQQVKQITLDGKLLYKSGRLPSEYQQVEYIQSSGTQYIDTGIIIGTNKLKYEFEIEQTGGTRKDGFIVGSSNTYRALNLYNDTSINRWKNYGDSESIIHSFSPNTKYNFVFNGENGYFNGTCNGDTFQNVSYSTDNNSILYLFKSHFPSSYYFIGKLYKFKFYQNNNLILDLIPCYRKSDGEIGLYDIQNNQFYTNSGTGSFTKGGDV